MERLRSEIKTRFIEGVIHYHPPVWNIHQQSWFVNFNGILFLKTGSMSLFQAGFPGQPVSLVHWSYETEVLETGPELDTVSYHGRVKMYRLQRGRTLQLQLFVTLENGLTVILSAPIHWNPGIHEVAS